MTQNILVWFNEHVWRAYCAPGTVLVAFSYVIPQHISEVTHFRGEETEASCVLAS